MLKEYGIISGKFCKNSIISIGNFDGIHKGHLELINRTKQIASQQQKNAGIITFDPNPIEYFTNYNSPIQLISTMDKVATMINKYQVDFVTVLKFEKIKLLNPEDFFNKIIIRYLSASGVIVGKNHTFGINKTGNIDTMQELCDKNQIYFESFNLTKKDANSVISSGNIRSLIKEGKIEMANEMLSEKFCIKGIIIKGNGIAGSKLGHKTANILLEARYIQPKYGVYAVMFTLHNKQYKAVANFGIRPTFGHNYPVLEVHVINQKLDNLYGERVSIQFVSHIRDEKKFDSIDNLKKQIEADCASALGRLP